jgi:flagellar L-ring protein precursor FlgH
MNKQLSWLSSGLFSVCMFAAAPAAVAGDTLWRDDVTPIIADKRAARVGDLLTIVVQQNTSTSKDNNTKTSKESKYDASIDSFLFSPSASHLATKGGKLPAMKFGANSGFQGGGSINNKETMEDRITVRVVDTQPNGQLIIEGTRQTAFGSEMLDVILRGTVRPEDISANNTVFSYNVADATIKFVSKGTVSDSQRKGLGTKIMDKLSPF